MVMWLGTDANGTCTMAVLKNLSLGEMTYDQFLANIEDRVRRFNAGVDTTGRTGNVYVACPLENIGIVSATTSNQAVAEEYLERYGFKKALVQTTRKYNRDVTLWVMSAPDFVEAAFGDK